MKRIIHNTVLLLMFLVSYSLSAQDELERYLQTAAENNPGLQARFSEYMAALEKVPQAGTLPDPRLAFGYFIQPVETRVGPQHGKISVSQMFPWFGTRHASEDVSIQSAKARYEAFKEAKSRLIYEVKSLWYNLYFTNKAINITHENINILNSFHRLALVKTEAGEGSAADVLRIEMEILELENQLHILLDKLATQQTVFNNLLNVEKQREVFIPEHLSRTELPLNREAILDSIRLGNHQVLSLEFQRASYEFRQVVAKKMGKPSFNIGMDYIIIGESSNDMLSAAESGRNALIFPMIGITVPLYREKYTSMVKEAVFMQESYENQKLDRINVLENIYEKANTDYRDAARRIEMHLRQLELAKKVLGILEAEYATDGRNFEEILRAERQVLMHSLELEKARTDLNASIAFIQYLMGN